MAQSNSSSTSMAIAPAKKKNVATSKLKQASLTAWLTKGKAGDAGEEKTGQGVSNNT